MNCHCVKPGFCETHQMHKDRVLFQKCQEGKSVIVGGKLLEPPGLIQQAFSYAVAMGKYVLGGSKVASESTIKERMDICAECPMMTAMKQCVLCGCNLKNKVGIAISQCPDNPPRWLAEENIDKISD